MTEMDPQKAGWFIFTLKSSFRVDNPSPNFKLITMEREYKFLLEFCRVEDLIDTSGRAFKNNTIM